MSTDSTILKIKVEHAEVWQHTPCLLDRLTIVDFQTKNLGVQSFSLTAGNWMYIEYQKVVKDQLKWFFRVDRIR